MFWKKSQNAKKEPEEDLARVLVRQDPRTKINTTTAQSETTNSTMQNATTFNANTNTVTFSTTRQTVTHTQKARVTEIVSRRTPTLDELEDMLRIMNLNKGETSGAQRRSGNFSGTNQRRSGNFSSTAGDCGISTKSTPKFKNTTDTTASPVSRLIFTYDLPRNSTTSSTTNNTSDISPKTPTLVKIQVTSFSQKSGRNVTSQNEAYRVKINPRSLYGLSTTTTTPTTTTSHHTKPSYNTTTTNSVPRKLSSKPSVNTPTLSKGKNSNLKPGCAYIFNNEHFDGPKNTTRDGSSEDVKMLCKTFENFKLKVTVIDNATLKEMKKTIAKIQKKDFSTHSSIVIVILSHGNRYEEISAKDGVYSIDDDVIFPILQNQSLIDKPKLIFIQACKRAMESVALQKDAALPKGTLNEILKCYSTFEGYVSYRSSKGSLFIQVLCINLQLFGGIKNIKDIMETVTLQVKQKSGNKQIPSITSTMTQPYTFGDYF